MALPPKCLKLSIYIGGKMGNAVPLYEQVVMRAKRLELAGASVFRGAVAYGHAKLLQGMGTHSNPMTDDLPVLIQIVDAPDKINAFVPALKELLGHRGLVTVEEVTVVHYGHDVRLPG